MPKRLTLDDLYNLLYSQGKNVQFSVKDGKDAIVVYEEAELTTDGDNTQGLLPVTIKVCHDDLNRNRSYISTENLKKYMPSLKNRPLLAYIHELPDGTMDFYAHNMEIEESEDEDEQLRVTYLERQVGHITEDEPVLEYDEAEDRNFVIAHGVIPEEYTDAADIIRRKQGTKVSCEIVVNELSYNAKKDYLELNDFYFGGVTLLGADEEGNEIQEGMKGARLDIADFCAKHDKEVDATVDIETMEQEVTVVEEETETTVEETEVVVEESETAVETEVEEESETVIEEAADESEADAEPLFENQFFKVIHNGVLRNSADISHDEIRYALYELLYAARPDDYVCIVDVYDDHFFFESWMEDKLYRQAYTIDGENVALEGDVEEYVVVRIPASKKEEVDAMFANYDSLVQFKHDTEQAAEMSAKQDIVGNVCYDSIRGTDSFKAVISAISDYSIDALQAKCDELLGQAVKQQMTFAEQTRKTVPGVKVTFGRQNEPQKARKPYGTLFDN